MNSLLYLLGILFYLGALACSIIIIIHAFRNEIWKGVLSLICGFYTIYYAFAEFQHEKKGLIIAGAFLGSIIGAVLMAMGGGGATAVG